ncbi:MAG: beta galactosidase jelly roll domain-containing protein [Clostridia bacterium]|nr:beta galactosidase jelly roll domain-containing protein [Clostridia bacterium]
MNYIGFSLNGTWEMNYKEQKYEGTENPFTALKDTWEKHALIENAVPGYWEDMTEKFKLAPFFCQLRINPEYGLQQYPISGVAPDMALPNVIGNFFYRRTFVCRDITAPCALHFEGVQNAVSVWINNVYLGRHEGYSAPFDFDIPEDLLMNGENTICLSVSNHRLEGYDGEPISGLTSRAANECTGGITGDLELRVYNCPLRDAAVLIAEDCNSAEVRVKMTERAELTWQVLDGEQELMSGNANGNFSFSTENLARWSPECAKLYTLRITCGEGCMEHTFGVRRLVADGVHFKLNGIPYFLRGVCEHCYFPDTIHPAHDKAYYRFIIKNLKKLGFNFIRFHTYVPEEEYMQAADELGMLIHVESPNNTTLAEWKDVVKLCRRHPSVVIYCCGNELLLDEPFIAHLNQCADVVHAQTDSLFSPFSALRGLEYFFFEPELEHELKHEPFTHNPRRIELVGRFSDMYSSYAVSRFSYRSLTLADAEEADVWSDVYKKPRVSHEICIDGTYTDLSLKDRYKGTRVGKTEMFSSLEKHLEEKGLLKKAPTFFKHSSEWQRRIRKYCFEELRRSNNMAGYDFLGPIDTHWHTFGYDVGMMNEFYELKPGETVRNVLMYNSETVLLTNLKRKVNFASGETLSCGIFTSCYHKTPLENATLSIRLLLDGKVIERKSVTIDTIWNGQVSKLYDLSLKLPEVEKPGAMKLQVFLDCDELTCENEWELYLFPTAQPADAKNIIIKDKMTEEELISTLHSGKDVLLLGAEPFVSLPTTFRIGLAGRTSGNLATVISDHPALSEMPHEGFCSWQFSGLMEDGNAICFACDDVPYNPIIEVASTHKFAIRQAAMFEFTVGEGRLFVCGFHFSETDPAAMWLKEQLIRYMTSDAFRPGEEISEVQLRKLIHGQVGEVVGNTNFAFNPNDKTATRKERKK